MQYQHSWPPTRAEEREIERQHCRRMQRDFNKNRRRFPCLAVKIFDRAEQWRCRWTKARLPQRQIVRADERCLRRS
jgi:hypothetical protein